jgi:hypothetical protein
MQTETQIEERKQDELAHMLERVGEMLTTLGDRIVVLEERSAGLESNLEKCRLALEMHDKSIRKLADIIAGASAPPKRREEGLN